MNTFENIGKPANTDLPDAYYGYDGNGNRAYKLTGTSELTHEYGPNLSADMDLSFPVLYVNPYMVLSPQGVFKYYYNGTQHIASRQCGPTKKLFSSILKKDTLDIANKIWRATSLMSRVLFYNEECNEDTLIHAPIPCIDINGVEHLDFAPLCSGIPQVACASFTYSPSRICSMLKDTIEEDWDNDVFFCHSDHLGSASWLTNDIGGVAQYIHYMPYGELWRDQQDGTYDERYKFTAKERDAETGYDYFGARYYASALPGWLSVDPLADKYTDVSPYAYCNWNPIKYIDSDGREKHIFLKEGESFAAKNFKDDNGIYIFGHGHMGPHGYVRNDANIKIAPRRMEADFLVGIVTASDQYKKDATEGDISMVFLYACHAGEGDSNIAQQLSSALNGHETYVVGPEGILESSYNPIYPQNDSYDGVKHSKSKGEGQWAVYKNGQLQTTIRGNRLPTKATVKRQMFFDNLLKSIKNFIKHENE